MYRGGKAVVVVSAAFTEIGEEGKKVKDEVLGIATRGGVRFVEPRCMGFWSASPECLCFLCRLDL